MKKIVYLVVAVALVLVLGGVVIGSPLSAQTTSLSVEQTKAKILELLQILLSLQKQLLALKTQQAGTSFTSTNPTPSAVVTLPASVADLKIADSDSFSEVKTALANYPAVQSIVIQLEKLGVSKTELETDFETLGDLATAANAVGGTQDVADLFANLYNLGARWTDIKSGYSSVSNFLTKMDTTFTAADLPYVNEILAELKNLGATWSDIKLDDGLGSLRSLMDTLAEQEDLGSLADILATLDDLGAKISDLENGFDDLGDAFDTMNKYGNGTWGNQGSGSGGQSGKSPLSDWSKLLGSCKGGGGGLPPGLSLGDVMKNPYARQQGPCGPGGCKVPAGPWDGKVPAPPGPEPVGPAGPAKPGAPAPAGEEAKEGIAFSGQIKEPVFECKDGNKVIKISDKKDVNYGELELLLTSDTKWGGLAQAPAGSGGESFEDSPPRSETEKSTGERDSTSDDNLSKVVQRAYISGQREKEPKEFSCQDEKGTTLSGSKIYKVLTVLSLLTEEEKKKADEQAMKAMQNILDGMKTFFNNLPSFGPSPYNVNPTGTYWDGGKWVYPESDDHESE